MKQTLIRSSLIKCAFVVSLLLVEPTFASGAPQAGYRPHPNPLSHFTNTVSSASSNVRMMRAAATSLPAKYDLRDIDGAGTSYLSPVRDQGKYGTCWTFAAMAGIEYQMRRDEGIDADLSENNLANLNGYDFGYTRGGNNEMASAVFLREEAPVSEALDPYPNIGKSRRERGVRIPRKIVFLSGLGYLDEVQTSLRPDLDSIKSAVMKYGPVSSAFYSHKDYYDGASYFYNGTNYVAGGAFLLNHAIAIVGWEDNYDKSNFKITPPGNGAFIIRNSWGVDVSTTDEGYNYISYYDTSLGAGGSAVFTSLSKGTDYARVYQHDPYGYITRYGYEQSTTAAGANFFKAKADETLDAFGFYALSPGTTYKAYIVKNASISSWYSSLSGAKTLVKSGTCADAGYEVIPFDTEISVSAGETFAICVEINTPGNYYPIAVMENFYGYLSKVVPEEGKSYINSSYRTWYWEDLSEDGAYFCCKVYTKSEKDNYTTTSEPIVPFSWLDRYLSLQEGGNYFTDYFYGSYNALADHVSANGYSVAQSYARGLDPDNASETNLLAVIKMDKNGALIINASPENKALWNYSIKGSSDLKSWHTREADDRFFKVVATPRE